ncbi:MAG: sensor histidine kinase [Gammaproteobacteria bacterium]|nr:MAG: sensor histidine kinase [Gammaproteobacteria bacterium]
MVVSFSAVTAHYFEAGLDISMRHSMRRVAWETPLDAQGVGTNIGFTVTRDWNQQAERLRKLFPDPPAKRRMVKYVEGVPIFGPPDRLAFAGRFENQAGEVRYVAGEFFPRKEEIAREPGRLTPVVRLILIATTSLVVFGVILLWLLRTLARPVERLGQWAAGLNEQTLSEPPPDFRYTELNALANLIRSSLDRARAGLEREHQFLRFASHELRTPITVARSNAELLRRMIEKQPDHARLTKVVERIERAGKTMGDLTETLLWLSREVPEALPVDDVDLETLTRSLMNDLQYLLAGKPVEIDVQTRRVSIQAPEVVLRIVLGNLLRNAFQHAQGGRIAIMQSAGAIRIQNDVDDGEGSAPETLGFGLGLELARRLATRYGWQCMARQDGTVHVAILTFNPPD